MKTVRLATGEEVPALGLGTWKMGVGDPDEAEQLRALKAGIERGMRLIDTAEMYGEGRSERLVAKAIAGERDKVFVVSKVLPSNASRKGTVAACEASLKRIGTDAIDLYLLHWRGSYPLAETFAAFETLKAAGKIRHYGVSNFDVGDMDEMNALKPKPTCAANQVLYNVSQRGIEFELYPKCTADHVAIMAYCPLGQGDLADQPALAKVARRHDVTPAAVAIAFTLRQPGVISIPKSGREARVLANAAANDVVLSREDLQEIDAAFPPPKRRVPLAIS
jgi:diketogulonate reductase-like aldo/keto reductase